MFWETVIELITHLHLTSPDSVSLWSHVKNDVEGDEE